MTLMYTSCVFGLKRAQIIATTHPSFFLMLINKDLKSIQFLFFKNLEICFCLELVSDSEYTLY